MSGAEVASLAEAVKRGERRAIAKAITLVESAKAIPAEQAAAREKLWTPEKEKDEGGAGQIWTPGS